MDRSDKITIAFMCLFLGLCVAFVVLASVDFYYNGIAADQCAANGYTGGHSHLWTGDVFCFVDVDPTYYSFPAGTPIVPLEKVEK